MLKKIILVLLACNISLLAISQTQADIQTPKIVPPSPDAAALGKYGQIPVDKSTGVPQISIPIYEIKTPRFSLPISLSYHASGIKVEEISSWVGAGWSLNAGGLITRSIIGMADDAWLGYINNTIKKASQIQWPGDRYYIADALNKRLDTDPDNFFYNFNNHSGSFVFGDDKKPLLIPYEPIKINFNTASRNFNLIDEQGNIYYFSTQEYVTSSISTYLSGISSWYLTKMISADLSDTINFVYATDAAAQTEYSYNFSQSITNQGGTTVNRLQDMVKNSTWRQFNPVRISSILFKGGKVDFIARGGRLDEANMSLDSVIISNLNSATNQYARLKSFKLLQDYFYSTLPIPSYFLINVTEADKHRLKLIGLQENDATNTALKVHQFDYNTAMLPQVHSFAQDKWGYFNGKVYNQTLLESEQVIFQPWNGGADQVAIIGGVEAGDRSVSERDMQAGVLQKITYPTKGYTQFTYECNKQQAIQYTSYNFSVAAFGTLNQGGVQEINTQYYTPTPDMINSGGNIFNIKLSSGNNPYGSSLIQYVKVVRVSDGTIIYNSYYNGAANTQISNLVLPMAANVQYAITCEAHGTIGGQVISQSPYATISTSYKIPNGVGLNNVGGLRIKSIKSYNSDGIPAGTETYYYGNNDESGGGVELAFLPGVHHHNFIQGHTNLINLPYKNPLCWMTQGNTDTYTNTSFYPMAALNGSPVAYPTVKIYHGDSLQNIGKSIYKYTVYPDSVMPVFGSNINIVKPISVSWKNGEPRLEEHYRNNGNNQYTLVQKTDNTYDIIGRKGGIGTTLGFIVEPIDYIFDNPVLESNGLVQAGSSGCGPLLWFQNDFYGYDYPISTGIRLLKQKITSSYAPDGITALTETINYLYDNLDHVQPTAITTTNSKGEIFKKQFKYPLDYTGITPYNTMVSRNILTPVIEQFVFKGASTTPLQSTRTNFGFWNGISWSATPADIIVPQTVETKNSFALQTNYETRLRYNSYDNKGNVTSVSKENDLQKVYIWGYNKTNPIAEVVGASYSSIMAILNQAVLDNPADDVSLRTELNKIRTSFPSAQVLSYTYKPLVGMTSQTDPNNRTTYYEYDAFNRLQLIKDQDGKILKKICYNYAGQPENCGVNATPAWASTGNLRCATSGGANTGYQEREEKDSNPNSPTYNQTRWLANGYNTGACPLPAVPCSFALNTGFNMITSGINSAGSTVSFYIVFYPTSLLQPGNNYYVGTINGGCRPSAIRTINYSSGGQNWSITIYPSGQMIWYLIPGSLPVNANSTIGVGTISYNL